VCSYCTGQASYQHIKIRRIFFGILTSNAFLMIEEFKTKPLTGF